MLFYNIFIYVWNYFFMAEYHLAPQWPDFLIPWGHRIGSFPQSVKSTFSVMFRQSFVDEYEAVRALIVRDQAIEQMPDRLHQHPSPGIGSNERVKAIIGFPVIRADLKEEYVLAIAKDGTEPFMLGPVNRAAGAIE